MTILNGQRECKIFRPWLQVVAIMPQSSISETLQAIYGRDIHWQGDGRKLLILKEGKFADIAFSVSQMAILSTWSILVTIKLQSLISKTLQANYGRDKYISKNGSKYHNAWKRWDTCRYYEISKNKWLRFVCTVAEFGEI